MYQHRLLLDGKGDLGRLLSGRQFMCNDNGGLVEVDRSFRSMRGLVFLCDGLIVGRSLLRLLASHAIVVWWRGYRPTGLSKWNWLNDVVAGLMAVSVLLNSIAVLKAIDDISVIKMSYFRLTESWPPMTDAMFGGPTFSSSSSSTWPSGGKYVTRSFC